MKKLTYTFALLLVGLPLVSSAMTLGDVEQQLGIYKSQAGSVLGVSTSTVDGTQTPPIIPLPPVPAPKDGGSSTDPKPMPPVPAPMPKDCLTAKPCVQPVDSTTDLPKLDLTKDQMDVLMKGLMYANKDSSTDIISKTIKPGATDAGSSTDVKKLQIFLNAKGNNLQTTGKYGAMTKKAVMKFQKEHGLKADGIVGPKVRKAIADEVKAAVADSNTNTGATQ